MEWEKPYTNTQENSKLYFIYEYNDIKTWKTWEFVFLTWQDCENISFYFVCVWWGVMWLLEPYSNYISKISFCNMSFWVAVMESCDGSINETLLIVEELCPWSSSPWNNKFLASKKYMT